ncbi:hypothetical protein Tsubulata_025149 [Turnera subulata]|uniref:SPARK domain-containing protein n=1 Tax=Turnera subulata TaxID=218843 RepID=A0A9Q0J5Y7_9ROSI|nr:hypothetical protein Tsubulata_025149 [Turnera subulata]
MNEGVSLNSRLSVPLLKLLLFALSFGESLCSPSNDHGGSLLTDGGGEDFLPQISPNAAPPPFLPLLAPSPLAPFTNSTKPKLSGLCTLNFTAAESLMSMTSTDCLAVFAPLLANVICCPQFEATLSILMGQSSKATNMLALNRTVSKHCLSDIEQILVGQGAADNLPTICAVSPTNLTAGYCPVKDVNEFEGTVDSSKLLAACESIDPVKECCDQICQNAILEAATRIALKASDVLSMDGTHGLHEQSAMVNDCKSIVLRWLASKLAPSRAKAVLRGLSNCKVNEVCPLVFPDMRHVAKGCGNGISNQTGCCRAMESYVSHLQKQSLITNLQALDCATTLELSLIFLHFFFSIILMQTESGCLLPSLPSDATFDKSSGISFICDLNDNIPAPWPSSSQLSASSCNKTIKIPALPAAANSQSGLYNEDLIYFVLFAASVVITMIL